MSKAAFDKIAGGLMEVVAIIQSEADPRTYRVHVAERLAGRAISVGTSSGLHHPNDQARPAGSAKRLAEG